MYRLLPGLERWLQRFPGFWRKLEANKPLPEIDEQQLIDHVVIIGYGRVGKHLVDVLMSLEIPILVVESDVERVEALNADAVATLYGDAANSEVITHAHLEQARSLVVTVPEESAAAIIVASARDLNPKLPIIVRAATEDGVHHLAALGATHIVHPELEGGLEMVHHTLLQLGFPLREVHEYSESVRRDRYDIAISASDEHRSLHDLLIATDSIEIIWLKLGEESPIVGKTLQEADIRSRTGASVVALIQDNHLIPNPKSLVLFNAGDRVGLIGEKDQIENARNWLLASP
jgi:CPA2 family monovalent cation:H+ antiporter-2